MRIVKKLTIMGVIFLIGLYISACGAVDNLIARSSEAELKLYEGIVVDNLEMVKEALKAGADINYIKGIESSESNPIWVAFKLSPSKRIAEYLITQGSDVNILDENVDSLLGWQANNCDTYFCDFLIKHGAKIDYKDKKGYTPLENVLNYNLVAAATEKNVNSIVTMLLEQGAKIRPESLDAILNGINGRQSKTMYLVKKRILEGVLQSGYKSGLDSALEASLLGDCARLDKLIKSEKIRKVDEEQIVFLTAAFGKAETMMLLKEKGKDIKYCDKYNYTLLMVAAYYGNLEMVKYLVNEGVDIEVRTTDAGSYKSALYFAVQNNYYEVVEFLIKKGADIKPYALDVGWVDVFTPAWDNGNVKIMNLLLDNGYKLDKSINDCLFLNALSSNDPDILKKYIGYKCKGFDYISALSNYDGKLETIKFLVENGTKINDTIESNEIMITASSKGQTEIVKYLITKGANVNAITVGLDGEVAGKKIDSALYRSIVNGNLDIVKLLVESGADIEQVLEFSDGTETAVITAAGCGSRNILEYLIKKDAKVNYQNSKGESALLRAAANGRIDNVKLLISNKADISLKDNEGHTALDLAIEGNYSQIVDLLKKSE